MTASIGKRFMSKTVTNIKISEFEILGPILFYLVITFSLLRLKVNLLLFGSTILKLKFPNLNFAFATYF